MCFVINSYMKNSQEYTAQDPLVNAAYNLLKSVKEGAHEPLNLPNEKELAMVITQLNFICHASAEIRDILTNGGSYPEWFQNKMSGLHSTMQDLHSYILGKESGELKEMTKAKLDKTNKISSDEYSKLRNKPYFNADEWKFSDKDMLYHRIVEEVQTEQVKTIKVGEDAVGTDAKLHYAVVSDRKVQAIGEKEEMLDYCKENGGRVWKTAKQVGDLVEETESNE